MIVRGLLSVVRRMLTGRTRLRLARRIPLPDQTTNAND